MTVFGEVLGQFILFHSLCSQGGRPARCFNVSSAQACLCLKRHLCVLVGVTRGCEFYGNPTGGGEKRSPPPQVQRLLLHVPWLHRRKRDCTPALFLTSSVGTSAKSLCTSEEEGLAPSPFLLTLSRRGPPPHNAGEYFRWVSLSSAPS